MLFNAITNKCGLVSKELVASSPLITGFPFVAVYYKLRPILPSWTVLLQIATSITKCDDYSKLRKFR